MNWRCFWTSHTGEIHFPLGNETEFTSVDELIKENAVKSIKPWVFKGKCTRQSLKKYLGCCQATYCIQQVDNDKEPYYTSPLCCYGLMISIKNWQTTEFIRIFCNIELWRPYLCDIFHMGHSFIDRYQNDEEVGKVVNDLWVPTYLLVCIFGLWSIFNLCDTVIVMVQWLMFFQYISCTQTWKPYALAHKVYTVSCSMAPSWGSVLVPKNRDSTGECLCNVTCNTECHKEKILGVPLWEVTWWCSMGPENSMGTRLMNP